MTPMPLRSKRRRRPDRALRVEPDLAMNRRCFLKLAGFGSVAFAAGCSPESPKHLHSQVHAPDDMVTGNPAWYASVCRECPAGCGILAKNREGRVIKLEGNPLHPVNRGRLCMRGQAALQAVYHPERLHAPRLKADGGHRTIGFAEAGELLAARARAAARRGPGRVVLVTETVGEPLLGLFGEALARWNAEPPIVFEPFAYEALKTANRDVFGIDGLPSYRLAEADLLVSFGADFLETWLSPVEYAIGFAAMHAAGAGASGRFLHVGPYQGLTGANADRWVACAPGAESAAAMGLLKRLLDHGRGRRLPAAWQEFLGKALAAYAPEAVLRATGMAPADFEGLYQALAQARRPLVLGPGTGAGGENGYRAHAAANLLNAVLDPELSRIDRRRRHRVEVCARRAELLELLQRLSGGGADLLILNHVNPAQALPPACGVREALAAPGLFVVSLSNFMDETAQLADLVLPVALPLETWDAYGGVSGLVGTLQPAMASLNGAPHLGDLLLAAAGKAPPAAGDYREFLAGHLRGEALIGGRADWLRALQRGGLFEAPAPDPPGELLAPEPPAALGAARVPEAAALSFAAAPSIRLFDGRGAERSWLNEIPEPLSRVAWQAPAVVHPQTAAARGAAAGDVVRLASAWGALEAPVVVSETVAPGVLVMEMGQGRAALARYRQTAAANPLTLLPPGADPLAGGPSFFAALADCQATGRRLTLARVDGSRTQHGRALALTIGAREIAAGRPEAKGGLRMHDFPLTLPLPEGYSAKRDFYPPHEHEGRRWGMVVDLDRCIGCGACAAACYAENNIAVVGEARIAQGREMAWMSIERYHDAADMARVLFLPMLCQHCDNAPCESVCPVYAPHHNAEGLNTQIYNRCIGTRFCSQNCPYKVRRFNWFDAEWPAPANLQLNPEVSVRSKGVMEKCSFCIQRIKAARTAARQAGRPIADGEVVPACVQTCPTEALVFGDLSDPRSRVRRLAEGPRAYQAMGHLNTKPAVIYLKKVLHAV
jgi:molybdopterin-containing oxidoreductase family iron-sulfur binding subunit